MTIDFFEREVKKAETKFNELFGGKTVCNLAARQKAILSICWLGVLKERIKTAKSMNDSKDAIREFQNLKTLLNNFLNQLERSNKDGRDNLENRAIA